MKTTDTLAVHHVGIQTRSLDESLAWYREFFGSTERWSLREFSDLTESRLPGITRLVEISVGTALFHLFERDGVDGDPTPGEAAQVQHICLVCADADELAAWREHGTALRRSGRHRYSSPEEPTEIVTDGDGVQSFYLLDPNGIEFEFTYIPGGGR